jgi:hypothetical protein
MKKILFGVLLLSVAMIFAACKKDSKSNSGSSLNSLAIKPATATLTPGETLRLTADYAPKGAKVNLSWESSNEDVVVVSENGTLTAGEEGEAVITLYEANSGKSAVCNVTVTSFVKSLVFTQACIVAYDIDSTELVTYHHSTFGDLKAFKAEQDLMLFSDGFYYNASGKLDGPEDAAIAIWPNTIYVAPIMENPALIAKFGEKVGNVGFTLGAYFVGGPDTLLTHNAKPGNITDEAAYVQDVVDGYNSRQGSYFQEAAKLQEGAWVSIFFTSTDDQGVAHHYSNYIKDGKVLKGSVVDIEGTQGSSEFMDKIDYIAMGVQYITNKDIDNLSAIMYGCYLTADTVNNVIYAKDNEVRFDETIVYTYGERPQGISAEPKAVLLPAKQPAATRMNLLKTNYSKVAFAKFMF